MGVAMDDDEGQKSRRTRKIAFQNLWPLNFWGPPCLAEQSENSKDWPWSQQDEFSYLGLKSLPHQDDIC